MYEYIQFMSGIYQGHEPLPGRHNQAQIGMRHNSGCQNSKWMEWMDMNK